MRNSSDAEYRPDIDGLRALAIVLVIFFHGFPEYLPSGFIGVDIFFVISGYLITTIILREIKSGAFTYSAFYARRFRRIVPSLVVVICVTYLLGWLLLFPGEYSALSLHAIYGSAFASNILLSFEDGYFDVRSEFKPLLHLWSLGVEEQFYLIWPIVLVIIAKLRYPALPVIAGLFVLSFLIMLGSPKTVAFFVMPARLWELLLGAGLSYAEQRRCGTIWREGQLLPLAATTRRHSRIISSVISIFAAGMLAIAVIGLTAETPFPGWATLLPTLTAVMFISAGPHAWLNSNVLGNRVAVAIGLISYPLYLWHWPLLSFARIVIGEAPPQWVRLALIVVSVILAWLTYRLIEIPVRRNLFASWRPRTYERGIIFLSIASLFLAIVFGCGVILRNGVPSRPSIGGIAYRDLGQDSYVAHLGTMGLTTKMCDSYRPAWESGCYTKANQKTVSFAMYGDSHAEHFIPGLLTSAPDEGGWIILNHSGCPPAAHFNVGERGRSYNCAHFNELALRFLRDHKEITTVALSFLTTPYFHGTAQKTAYVRDGAFEVSSDLYTGTPKEMFAHGLAQTIKSLGEMGKRVVLIIDNPELPLSLRACARRQMWNGDLASRNCTLLRAEYERRSERYRETVSELERTFPRLLVYDPIELYCNSITCRYFDNGRFLYRDEDHLSVYGSNLATAHFLSWLAQQSLPSGVAELKP